MGLKDTFLADAKALIDKVAADPTALQKELTAVAGAVKTTHDFVSALAVGDTETARRVLAKWDDVDETKLAAGAVEAENAKSGTIEKVTSVLETVGKVAQFGVSVASFVAPLI